MRIAYQHGLGDYTFPVLRCHHCGLVYPLPQSVRQDTLMRDVARHEAQDRGWTVPEDGPVCCPGCADQP